MSLNLSLLHAHPAEIDTDAVIAAVFEDGSLSAAAKQLDIIHQGVTTVELSEWIWDLTRFKPFVFEFNNIFVKVSHPAGKNLKIDKEKVLK